MATALPRPSQPPFDPPTAALPALPVNKTRKSLPSPSTSSRIASPALPPSKIRVPSKTTRLPTAHANSSSAIPTSSKIAGTRPATSDSDKNVRRAISSGTIGAFPQPPKSTSKIGRPSLGGSIITSNLEAVRRDSKTSTTPTTPGSSASSARPKRLRKATSSAVIHTAYTNKSPSLLNGSGDSVPIFAGSTTKRSDGFLSLPSPSPSRTSSPGSSYSTTATTFEDIEEVAPRGREEAKEGSENGSSSDSKEIKGNVLVSVRVRPDDGGDIRSEGEWMVDGRRSLVAFGGREGGNYYYDNVFTTHDNNAKVYETCAKRLVRRVMQGYHGTVFAYGMTGTGKTFSMQGTQDSPGVIPRAITDIFSFIRETPRREFLLRTSYLEIYNEEIRDLLAPAPTSNSPSEKIKLREDSERGVYATPVREEIVQSPMQLLRVISRGDRERHTGTTQYNLHSSRSHAIVKIVVESRDRAPTDVPGSNNKRAALVSGGVRVSTLSLIDLAGSEKAADSKQRRTEGAHINKSLLTLGTVIARLSGNRDKNGSPTDKEGKHLPYRDSKLTRLLQPALSGSSLISILCTIQIGSVGSAAAANSHTGETLNTLKFAARAKNNIVSHAKRAEEAVGSGEDAMSRGLLERYRLEIQNLRGQLDDQIRLQAEREEKLMEKEAEDRHKDQMVEMQLARTALKERIEHLNRLILSSQSQGVNASGSYSSLGVHSPALYVPKSPGLRSIRSFASASTIGRTLSGASTATMSTQIAAVRSPNPNPETPRLDFDLEGDEDETQGDGTASLPAQVHALQADLAAKNRYIATLEKRLLQARRSSNSRSSGGISLGMLQEKDAEIARLRTQVEELTRTVTRLRSAHSKSKSPDLAASSSSNPASPSVKGHHPSDSYGSTSTTNSTSLSPIEIKKSPFEILASPPARSTAGLAASREMRKSPFEILGSPSTKPTVGLPFTPLGPPKKDGITTRKSFDEMSRILDEMIQEKVETGELIADRKHGGVKLARERRQESLGAVPSVEALGANKPKPEAVEKKGAGLGIHGQAF